MSEENKFNKISLPTILIGIAGFFVSMYALIIHIQTLMQPGHGTLCDVNSKFNCSSVIGSSYGEFASIPLGSYGMTYFILILSAAILPKISNVTKKQLILLEFFIGAVGFLFVLSLIYISHFILKTICPTCSIIHVLTFIYFALKTQGIISSKGIVETNNPNSDYFIRFIAVSICLGIPPLAAGLVAPIVIDKFVTPTKVTNSIPVISKTAPVLPVADFDGKLIPVNKTNFVGNGEDYRRGSDDAKIIVQMFSDFGCPHCRSASAGLLQAQEKVGLNKVLIVYRFFPLSNKCNPFVPNEGWYPYSCVLAQAARCAGSQGKFWEFKDWGFSGQDLTDDQRAQSFSMSGLKEEAKSLGLNETQFSQCIENNVELNKIKEDASLADKLKIKGTPLILINGREYTGPHSSDDFVKAFQAAE